MISVLTLAMAASAGAGQSITQLAATPGFSPGSQDVFALDFTGMRPGTIPRGILRTRSAQHSPACLRRSASARRARVR